MAGALISFKGIIYHIKSANSLTDLKSRLQTRIQSLLHNQSLCLLSEHFEPFTEAHFRQSVQNRVVVTLWAEAYSGSESGSSKGTFTDESKSSDSIPEGNPRMRDRSPNAPAPYQVPPRKPFSALVLANSQRLAGLCVRDLAEMNSAQLIQLGACAELETLRFEGTGATQAVWDSVVRMVGHSGLSLLEVRSCSLSPATLTRLIGEYLTKRRRKELSVHESRVLGAGEALVCEPLTSLELVKAGFGQAQLKWLRAALGPSMVQLDLSKNCLGPRSDLEAALKGLTSLACLNLADNGLGPAGISNLTTALQTMSSLTSLNLAKNFICDSGISSLQSFLRNSYLEALDLSWSAATEGFSPHNHLNFRYPSSLISLKFSHNPLRADRLYTLRRMLGGMTHLQAVELADCCITRESLFMIFEDAPKPDPKLRLLNLSCNLLQGLAYTDLNSLFPSLTSLYLESTNIDLAAFFHGSQLSGLLTSLNLSLNPTSPFSLSLLSSASQLVTLKCSTCVLTGSANPLAQKMLGSMEEADFSFCDLKLMQNLSFSALFGGVRVLRSLNLRGNALDENGFRSLFSVLEKAGELQRLDLSLTLLSSRDLESLPTLSALCSFKAAHNALGLHSKSVFDKLISQPRLRKVDLSGNGLTFAFLDKLRPISAWTKLNLTGNPLGSPSLPFPDRIITKLVVTFPALMSLKLGNAQLGSHMQLFLTILQYYPSLQELDLAGNSFSAVLNTREERFVQLPCLKALNIANIGVDSAKIVTILSQTTTAEALERLNLSRNSLKTEGFARISELLGKFAALKHLNVSGNGINFLPTELLRALQALTCLKSLNLAYNSLSCEACVQLWLLCKQKKPIFTFLRDLNLSHNLISGKGALYLCKVLPLLPSLTVLDYSYNRICKPRLRLLEACGD